MIDDHLKAHMGEMYMCMYEYVKDFKQNVVFLKLYATYNNTTTTAFDINITNHMKTL